MDEAFVIMQIGNSQLDNLWKDVYCPAIKECGLEPRRVDKHNEGRLLQSEIASFIGKAKIVIADLTNERQNCYLEVGYTMGLGKFKNLVLCAREDHHHESPTYVKGGPKIHFDLSGYGFLWWNEKKLDEFKKTLISRIKQRLGVLEEVEDSIDADIWLEEERQIVLPELKKLKLEGFYEISFEPSALSSNKTVAELLKIAGSAEIHISGWPIGVVLNNEGRPKPQPDGIRCIIAAADRLDYWTLKKDGRFYFLRSFEEDTKWKDNKPGENIHFDTRIRRITEAIMYCARLYKEFGISEDTNVVISITHSGLSNRMLAAADPNRLIMDHWKCTTDKVHSKAFEKISNLMPRVKDIVFNIANELSMMFDYFDLNRGVCDGIVDKFISGKF